MVDLAGGGGREVGEAVGEEAHKFSDLEGFCKEVCVERGEFPLFLRIERVAADQDHRQARDLFAQTPKEKESVLLSDMTIQDQRIGSVGDQSHVVFVVLKAVTASDGESFAFEGLG